MPCIMWELDVLQWFDSVHGPVLDPLMVGITYSATSGLVWFVLGFLMTCSRRWRRCGVSVIVSVAAAYVVVDLILKPLVCRDRPFDVSDFDLLVLAPDSWSFPSGHTANAFMIATMMYKEYGELSPWIGIGSYASASTVAVMRMLNNRHWMSDVLFGAGIGILSTELGYYLSDLIFKKKKDVYFKNRDIDYTQVPSFLEYSVGYSCLFPQLYYSPTGERNLHAYGGFSASLSGAHYFASGWGIGGSTTILSAKLSQEGGTLGSTAFLVGPEYSACICPRLFWNANLHLGGGSLLLDQDIKKNGFAARVGASLLGQLSPTMGLRLFANYTYTTLSGEPVYKDLSYLSVGIAACALF